MCGIIDDSKVAGLDGVPNKASGLPVKFRPDMFAACPRGFFLHHESGRTWSCHLRLVNLEVNHRLIDLACLVQRSTLSPWNIQYHDVLDLFVPKKATVVDYANACNRKVSRVVLEQSNQCF